MPECSLCKGQLGPEGGEVLFTDYRGIPFEVCGKCLIHIDMLHNPSSGEDENRALDYVYGCAENIENRGVYDELMRFIEREVPESNRGTEDDKVTEEEEGGPPQAEESGEGIGNGTPDEEPATGGKKRRGALWAIGVAVVVFLVLAYVLFGVRIG